MAFIYDALTVDNIAALKALTASTEPKRVDKIFIAVANNGEGVPDWYQYKASSSTAESLPAVVSPTDTIGRWFAFKGAGGAGGGMSIVTTVTALKNLSPAPTDNATVFLVEKGAIYAYDLEGTGTGNDEWLITPTSNTGRWYPVTAISGITTPSGVSDYPVIYRRVTNSSTFSEDFVDRVYYNPGGGRANWNYTATTS